MADLGYTTVLAENGEQGLRQYQADPQIKVIFLDWHMPVATGMDMIKSLRANPSGPLPYVVMMTTATHSDVVLTAFAAGVHDCLPKPIEANHVWARMKAAERFLSLDHADHELPAEQAKDFVRNSEIRTVNHLVHEVSTPMATTKLAVILLRIEFGNAAAGAERYLAKIEKNIQRAVDIMRNQQKRLLAQPSSFQETDLVAVLKDAVATTCFE